MPAESQDVSMPLVGVCPKCEELFALPRQTPPPSHLGCPHCEAQVAYEGLKVRGLRPAVVVVADEPVPVPTAQVSGEPVAAPQVSEEPTLSGPRPTLSQALGWKTPVEDRTEAAEPSAAGFSSPGLSGTGSSSAKSDAPETTERLTEQAEQRLEQEVDSLLASAEQFREGLVTRELGTPPVQTTEETGAAPAEPTAPKPTAAVLKDFGFDFRDTPLAGADAPAAEQANVLARASIGIDVKRPESESPAPAAAFVGGEVSTLLGAPLVGEATPTTDELLDNDQPSLELGERRGSRWTGALSAAAGLLIIGAPAAFIAWFGFPGAGPAPLEATEDGGESVASLETTLPSSGEATPVTPRLEAPPASGVSGVAAVPDQRVNRVEPPAPIGGRYASGQVEAATYEIEADPPPPAPWSPPVDETSAEAAPPSVASAGSRYGTTPKSLEQQSGEPPSFVLPVEATKALPTAGTEPVSRLPVVGAPTYSASELGQLASASIDAAATFAGGKLSDPEQAPALGQAYARLCKLSEALTLLDPATPTTDRRESEFAALDVFQKLLREEDPRESSRAIARHWIEWTERPHGGVFFAARPAAEPRKAGDVFRYVFELDGVAFPVITSEKILARRFISTRAQAVGVLGVVVESPVERIEGYQGDDERVVWVRKTIALRQAGAL